MLEVKFYDTVDDSLLKFAVIISQSNGKWVFCKHKERDTYEVPGGHREAGENILETAKRELQEETGAIKFALKQNVQFPSLVQEYKVPTPADIPLHHSLNPQVEPSKNLNQSFCHPDHHNHEILHLKEYHN